MQNEFDFVVIGGGPAGLTAAHELVKRGNRPIVLEKYHLVGGIARTESYKGYHFDMGGHRFFTKSKEVNDFWYEILEDQFLKRPRLSRIYYRQRFFDYPLKPANALRGLGTLEAMRIACSYLRWSLFPYRKEETFEQWVTNRFGKRLFEIFFKSYTEKVWGIPCSELRAEWAAQRIKDLSLKTAVLNMFVKPRNAVKTLIDTFHYPRLGPGMLWGMVRENVEKRGGHVWLESDVSRVRRNGEAILSVTVKREDGEQEIRGEHFLSSMPVKEFLNKLDPPPPENVLNAAQSLKYRDFLTVCLIVKGTNLFPDNWIYVHEPDVQVGRIQNFGNWSPDMVPEPNRTSLGLEYFCNEGDDLWNSSDDALIEQGSQELERLGLVRADDVLDGCVFRVPKTYPVYDSEYVEVLNTIKEYVGRFRNFQTIGRNGLHRYNNQDHAMLTGMLAVRNALDGEENDLWVVNADKEYHEEIRSTSQLQEGEGVEGVEGEPEAVLASIFAKLDREALGISLGVLSGVALFLMTIILHLKGGAYVGTTLSLLSNYFPGYRVSAIGSLIGLGYGFLAGFVVGWTFAFLRNLVVFLCFVILWRRAHFVLLRRFFDYT